MKKIIIALCACLVMAQSWGQSTDGSERKHVVHASGGTSTLYITVSTGLNNNTGIIGPTLEFPVSPRVSLEVGAGVGTWGSKIYGGGKYFLRPGHLGWAFGAGITHNTGLQNFTTSLETVNGDNEQVTVNLQPQTNLLLAAYRYWRLGQGRNRIYLELGYSVPFNSNDRYEQTDGTPIDQNGEHTLDLLAPGGLVVAVGFSFGIK